MSDADVVPTQASTLKTEAERANERRVLALRGGHQQSMDAARRALNAAGIALERTTLISERDGLACERRPPREASVLLGTTRDAVVLDWHDTCRPNALGQVVGTVAGGGLLILLVPAEADWGADGCAFHESLAVPPHETAAVTSHYHDRLSELLETHPGIGVIDLETGTIQSRGTTNSPPAPDRAPPTIPSSRIYPQAAYELCLTQDQVEAVATLECLTKETATAIIEADRGRGKSSAAGLAAGALASRGDRVAVSAPTRSGTTPLFDRAGEVLDTLGVTVEGGSWRLDIPDGGSVTFHTVDDATDRVGDADVLLVDEAAGLSVRRLESFLAADRVAFLTTIHGYEGAGRGFDVRFRDRLRVRDRSVEEYHLREPIRYALGDPVEAWANRVLLLDARPPVDQLVETAEPSETTYRRLSPSDLLGGNRRLREIVGLLVEAHYRTEPNDIVRLLDAPNVRVRALTHEGRVVSVCVLATEGGLPEPLRTAMYEGRRVRGNMLPDVFASQLRDVEAAAPSGVRILRIATHEAVRSRGLASSLLASVRDELGERSTVDWLGVGYGATPALLRFWEENQYRMVHLSTTRNERSGEYSALMLHPLTDAGDAVHDRLGSWFGERIPAVLGDALSDLDPDVARKSLRAVAVGPELTLSNRDWRVVAGAAYGPGLYDVDPRPFRSLAVCHLIDGDIETLDDREERLLVTKVLQGRSWESVTERLDYASQSECKRAIGDVYASLADVYGGDVVATERARYQD